MPNVLKLISVFEDLRLLLEDPSNDYSWSSWDDEAAALREVDAILRALRLGTDTSKIYMGILFAPTGPAQEVSLSSGWGDKFDELADRFDEAMASRICGCPDSLPTNLLVAEELGMDRYFAEIALLNCADCGQTWLRYHYENEGISRSGRWFLVPISLSQEATKDNAQQIIESAEAYFYGGSYYEGQSGQASGPLGIG